MPHPLKPTAQSPTHHNASYKDKLVQVCEREFRHVQGQRCVNVLFSAVVVQIVMNPLITVRFSRKRSIRYKHTVRKVIQSTPAPITEEAPTG